MGSLLVARRRRHAPRCCQILGLLCLLKSPGLASSFGRVVSARRYAQRRHGGFDGFAREPNLLQRLYAMRSFFCGRFWYPVVGSDHVIGVGVVAQVFDHVAGEGRREFVMSHETGQGPGSVAGQPSGTYAAPLEEELSYAGVGVELQDDGAHCVLV